MIGVLSPQGNPGGGYQVVLVEPEGELGTPQQKVLAIKITLDEALCLKNHTDFIVIHGLTRTQGNRLGYRKVWMDTYARTATISKHEFIWLQRTSGGS
jgi:hypothetical protein